MSAPVRSGGGRLIAYELRVSNTGSGPIDLDRLEVRGSDGRLVASFVGPALVRRSERSGADGSDEVATSVRLPAGGSAVLFVELDLALDARVPSLGHRLSYRLSGGRVGRLVLAPVRLEQRPPVVLAPPLRGGQWVAVHDPSWPRGHRRVSYAVSGSPRIPGRYAIDWVGVDGRGRTTRGDPDRPEDSVGYGATVLAGADAVVAATRDGMAEGRSIGGNAAKPLGDGEGNYVVLRVAPRTFAFYEHLRPGSVRVRPGQRVRAGDAIGELGFSGDTTGPHLHLHVANCASPLACEGIPYAVRGMRYVGRYPDFSGLGVRRWNAVARVAPRLAEWPASSTVVVFR